jgi:hypothetical protein
MEDVEGRHRQREQLIQVGIDEPWMIRLARIEAAIYPDQFDLELPELSYIVLGSFEDVGEARLFSAAMAEKIGISSSVRSIELNGQIRQHVLIGPYYGVDETQPARRLAMDAGIADPWILPESRIFSTAGPDPNEIDELLTGSDEGVNEPTVTDARPRQRQRDLQQEETAGYSFATLRRRTGPLLFEGKEASKKKNACQSGAANLP